MILNKKNVLIIVALFSLMFCSCAGEKIEVGKELVVKQKNQETQENKKKEFVKLPEDDGFIDGQDVQWWYWTGHLEDENGQKYGFEVVFFSFNKWVFINILGQAAISDVSRGTHLFRQNVDFFTLPKKLDSKFVLETKKGKEGVIISAVGALGKDKLSFKVGDYDVTLLLEDKTSPVIHYNGRIHKYSFGGDTFYYSRKNMNTTGVIRYKGGEEVRVKGVSWFDRQYGSLFQAIFKGWQWFSIKLNDGTEIMLYHFREEKFEKERFASVTKNGKTVDIPYNKYSVEEIKTWRSPHTGNIYPSAWRVKIDKRDLIVLPVMEDQELRVQDKIWFGPEYWEGTCRVYDAKKRKELGRAYVELNGYGKNKFITIRNRDEKLNLESLSDYLYRMIFFINDIKWLI